MKRGVIIKEGDRINRWTVIKEVESKSGSSNFEDKRFLCRCDCGTERVLRYKSLAYKTSKSCGCYMREFNSKNRRKFPKDTVKSRIYTIWNGIKCRCYTTSSSEYKRYGAKGITMCDEWKNDFMSFYNWSISNGYADNLTIDRIDYEGNYEPSNCRWVTQKEQMNNVRYNRILTLNGVSHTLSEWGEITGIAWTTIQSRKRNGWSDKEALTTPIGKAKGYDVRVGKDELAAIFNNSIASGLCVSKIDFARKAGISKSVFFSTLYGDGRMSKKTSEKVRSFYKSNISRSIETI